MNPDFTPQPNRRKTETVWILRNTKPISVGPNKGKREIAEFRDSGGDYIRFRFGSSPEKGNDTNCPAGRYDSVKRQFARNTWNRLVSEGWVFVNSCVQWDSEEFMDYKRWEEKYEEGITKKFTKDYYDDVNNYALDA
tara:strand:- start:303 stop:713 length:411 start_codon:yes stop_codon:yes gene_type:complete